MTNLPKKKFLRSAEDGDGPGVLTTLLRVYVEERDRTALDTFFELLYNDHFTDLALQVHNYGKASDVTVKEVVDDSLAKLLEDVVNEKYRKAPASAAEHLKYLLLRRFIDRRRYWDRKHEDVVDHQETILDRSVANPATDAQIRESGPLLDARLDEALASMPEQHARIIRMRLEGRPHEEIARELGLQKESIKKTYARALDQLMSKLVTHSPSMVLRFKDLKAQLTTRPSEVRWPSLEQVKAALPGITERVRTVLDRLHFQGISREALAREFGADLEILLRRGYDILEARFKVSFPEAFERAKS